MTANAGIASQRVIARFMFNDILRFVLLCDARNMLRRESSLLPDTLSWSICHKTGSTHPVGGPPDLIIVDVKDLRLSQIRPTITDWRNQFESL